MPSERSLPRPVRSAALRFFPWVRPVDGLRSGPFYLVALSSFRVVTARQSSLLALFAAALVLLLGWPGSVHAGGSPIGFVSLPAQGQLAVISLPGGGQLARVAVPGKPDAVAASVNGRRVLVASPSAGTVTEINGFHPRVLHVFSGFDRPVAIALDYEPPIGVVTPRYAFVLEQARGTLAVLDLPRRRIASRLAVGPKPQQLAVDGTIAWVTHATGGRVTRVDITQPARPHLLEPIEMGQTVAAVVADPESHAVFVASRRFGAVTRYLDDGARARSGYRTTLGRAPLAGIALAPPDYLIAADRHGALHVLRPQTGRPVSELHLPAGVKRIDVYGGWLVATRPRSLSLLAVPDGSMRTSVPFPTNIGGFAWAVL
jgi:hypothetical protein